jgi:hypothetical protein
MKPLIIFLLCFIQWSGFSQHKPTDTLIYFNELSYSTADEEKYIRNFFEKKDSNYFAIFYFAQINNYLLSINTPKERFYKIAENLNTSKFEALKPEKKIKAIHDNVQKQYFTKYELNTTFDQIFTSGLFNCVTGTALHGMLLHELHIPFEIKETENHVFIISYPNHGNIKLEATDPMQRVFLFNDKFKEGWVEYLVNSKIIDQQERNSKTKEELFNTYYFSDTHLSLKELAGLQYYNNSVSLINEKKYMEALHQIEKAYIFYPSERIEYTLLTTLALAISQTKYDNITDADLFIKISRFLKRNLTLDLIKSEFARITQLQLIDKSRLDHYKQLFNSINDRIQDKELLNEIAAIYHYEVGRYLYNKGERSASREYFFNALLAKPANSDMRAAFIGSILEFSSERDLYASIEKIEKYIVVLPFLKENERIGNVLMSSYLAFAYQAFLEVKMDIGNDFLKKFEMLNSEQPTNYVGGELLANAYSSASAYYYKRNNIKKAREYIHRGLKIDPNNYYLKNLLRSM